MGLGDVWALVSRERASAREGLDLDIALGGFYVAFNICLRVYYYYYCIIVYYMGTSLQRERAWP